MSIVIGTADVAAVHPVLPGAEAGDAGLLSRSGSPSERVPWAVNIW